jgi:hypothetical protein
MFLFFPLVLDGGRQQQRKPLQDVGMECFRLNPRWMKGVLYLFCFYVVFCMISGIFHLDDPSGSPEIINGKMVLAERGHITKELTAEEYAEYVTSQYRGGMFGLVFMYYFEVLMYTGLIRYRSRLHALTTSLGGP